MKILREKAKNFLMNIQEYTNPFPYRKYMKNKKCIFIHIPKTAGTSLRVALGAKERPRDHFSYKVYEHASPVKFKNYFKFCVVRNPWSRVFSIYNYLKKNGNNTSDLILIKKLDLGNISFRSFVLEKLDTEIIQNTLIFKPQCFFIYDEFDNLMVDKLIKLENIENEYKILKDKLNLKADLGKINVSGQNNYKEQYDVEMIEKIEMLYRKDVELLDYDF